jgi:uncharacterized Zn finger protein
LVSYYDYGWKPYVPVAERRRKAARELEKRRKKGHDVSPVVVDGRTIAKTFWGKAWCENLEGYSDYANRLPRGRTYVRNGSVVDLKIAPGSIKAMVSGSSLYTVELKVAPLAKVRWKSIREDCAGAIDSLVELLQGRFSKGVMERICRQDSGLFPSPSEIKLSCSCPDWADMCKHVAAVLYGIGARFDRQPELLFRLREVDEKELIAQAGKALPLAKQAPAADKVLSGENLSDIFGLDMAQSASAEVAPAGPKPVKSKPTKKASSAKKKTAAAAPQAKRKPRKPAAATRPPKRTLVARKPRGSTTK